MWLVFAFSGPVLWAASTHVDKFLVEKYFKQADVAVLLVFTALIGLLVLPLVGGFDPEALTPGWKEAGAVACSGLLYMTGMYFYLLALQQDEASVVAPFEYSALAWDVAIDWLLWQTLPDQYTLIGATIIIGSGIYLIRHEKVHA